MTNELDPKSMMLGSHEARLDALETGQRAIAADVKTILSYVEQRKGSWKTFAGIGAAIATVVECAHQVATFIHKG